MWGGLPTVPALCVELLGTLRTSPPTSGVSVTTLEVTRNRRIHEPSPASVPTQDGEMPSEAGVLRH